MNRRQRRGVHALFALGMALLVISVVVVLLAWKFKGLNTAADFAQIVGVIAAVGIAMGPFLEWWWNQTRPSAAGQDSGEAVTHLRRLVAEQWRKEATLRALSDPKPMPIEWRLTSAPVMDRPAQVSGAAEATWEGTSDAIGDLTARYRALPGRRLVILGGPGAGKTTLAVQLVRELLRRPEGDESVPVLLSVSSWDPRVTDDIWVWLRAQIELAYPSLTPEEVGTLVADKRVFPVLDGLDEVPSAVGESVLWALNRSLDDGPVIITCRTDDYRRLIFDRGARELVAAAAIDSLPLPGPVAAEYLESRLPGLLPPGWQRILERLRTDPDAPLTELCTSPLGLWLLCASYVEGDQRDRALGYSPGHPGDLDRLSDRAAYPDTESLRAHLYDRLIPVLISFRKPARDSDDAFRPRRLHSAPDTARRLSFLAHLLSEPRGEDGRPRTRDLAWWEVAAVTDRAPAMAGVVVGTVIALLFTASLTFLAGPILGVLAGLAGGGVRGPRHQEPVCPLGRWHARQRLPTTIPRPAPRLAAGPVGPQRRRHEGHWTRAARGGARLVRRPFRVRRAPRPGHARTRRRSDVWRGPRPGRHHERPA